MAKGFLFLILGTAGAQVIALVSTPFLARLYSPEYFGSLAIIVSIVTIYSSIGNAKLDLALQNVRSTNEVKALVFAALYFNTLVVVVSCIGYMIAAVSPVAIPEVIKDNWLLILLAVVSIFQYNILVGVALRLKHYRLVSLTKVINVISMTVIQFAFYLQGDGLIVGYCASFILSIIFLSYRRDFQSYLGRRDKDWKNTAFKSIEFVKYTMPASLLNSISNQSPILIFPALFGVEIAGLLMLSQKLISAPVKMVADAISKVIYSNSTHLEVDEERSYIFLIFGVFYSSLPVFVWVYFNIEAIFLFTLGEEWARAGIFAKYVVILSAFTLLGMPLYNLSLKLGMNRLGMVFELCISIVRVASILLSYCMGLNDDQSVLVFFLTSSLCWVVYLTVLLLGVSFPRGWIYGLWGGGAFVVAIFSAPLLYLDLSLLEKSIFGILYFILSVVCVFRIRRYV